MVTIPSKGELAILYGGPNLVYLIRLDGDSAIQTARGIVSSKDCIGKPFGTKISVGKSGNWFVLLPPFPGLVTLGLVHHTQILYRCDIAFIALLLDVKPGDVVVESGTGSGSMSYSLSCLVSPGGTLHSFEYHKQRSEDARALCDALKQDCLKIYNRDVVQDGFIIPNVLDMNGADSAFLDLPSPWNAISHVHDILKPLGRCVNFSPCIEQVQRVVISFKMKNFEDIRTFEVVCKPWGVKVCGKINSYQIPYYSHTGYITVATKSPVKPSTCAITAKITT
ncbi:tRNA (adenine-N1-)-methyltransferase catalytic subunit [Babesia microti strain RI]|uniref:tRNA (adenine(58)-N(1))-methyltransferase n=1 Tax=Babesia microti (strain RI) TaxID=1133968 RepID=I7J8Z8_BABMR|nr:tRNA (adenine-N1-)-methyltransferase catalytic subunit [Babesia microti strain RI]CCF73094.1 tRNA (adenine-N1-)-methyltransferase catalytic subunit [Babesia microti strain RI]|eukprot:XP_012647703.1 tRNA (adenine-N1-)-methyltransferase catalytic subunit [Babesia microti strain RI]